jgi:hypothetical protein
VSNLVIADRVKDTTTTTGTGTVTVSGSPPTGFRAFSTVMVAGDTCWYTISSSAGAEWEVGWGTLVTATTISRDVVYASSNSNALVSFSAGTKDVFITNPAAAMESQAAGWAISRGFALN